MIYVDIVIYQPGTGVQNNRKWVLIIIAIYGTSQFLIKALLAIFHHIKWLVCNCGCGSKILGPDDRENKVKAFWEQSNRDYRRERRDLNP
jgi:hypothetical protein